MIKNPLIGKGAALSEGCAFGFMIFELIAQKDIESPHRAEILLKSKCNVDPENQENRDRVEIKVRSLMD